MPFPEVPRVIYAKNPLDEVICQLRFPTILKIDTDLPAAFQDRIRARYPLYEAKSAAKLPPNLPQELAKQLAATLPPIFAARVHDFTTPDRQWTVSLTKDFLALTCRKYRRWEQFKEHLGELLAGLRDIYAPAFFSRLGLRYRDVIRRSDLGMENADWSELLKPWIAGVLSAPDVSAEVQHVFKDFIVRLPSDNAHVRVQHAIVRDDKSPEPCYLIDADFSDEQQTETNHAIAKLDFLNRQARYLFRWCISDKLHRALEPTSVADA
jgi:uncharacterized protein (TIGR04255 family)